MKKNRAAPVLAVGLLALALTSCSADATTASATDQPTAASASASVTANPAASKPSSAVDALPGTLYENPVHPAGDEDARFRIAWDKSGEGKAKDMVPGTAENPTGIDFSQLIPSTDPTYKDWPLEDQFTDEELEEYATKALNKYLAVRTDPRLFEGDVRTFETDEAVMAENKAAFTDRYYEQWLKQEEPYHDDWEPIWTLTPSLHDAAEGESDLRQIENSSDHHLAIGAPEVYGFRAEHGARVLGLKFKETLTMDFPDDMVATTSATEWLQFNVMDGDPIMDHMGYERTGKYTFERG